MEFEMFNVERTPCAPPSLLKQKKYDDNDVWQALENIFYKKCYLCETVQPLDLNVEHLKSHKGDKALKFSWGNLYFACARCNNIKSTRYDDILDCCNPGENVFESIKCLPPHSPRSSRLVVEALSQYDRVIKTCELLNEIYNNASSVNKKNFGSLFAQQGMGALCSAVKVYG
ncbi:MAG TPA: hypothetical protein PKE57_00145 [Cellvibrionaceae bacterium]|nr:hypothetical protein [Cellvibrionaceae bacterium]